MLSFEGNAIIFLSETTNIGDYMEYRDPLSVVNAINRRKDIMSCPCCGGKSFFRPSSSISYNISCFDCGMSSKSIDIPSYYTKKRHYLFSVYFKCLELWNRRTGSHSINIYSPLLPKGF